MIIKYLEKQENSSSALIRGLLNTYKKKWPASLLFLITMCVMCHNSSTMESDWLFWKLGEAEFSVFLYSNVPLLFKLSSFSFFLAGVYFPVKNLLVLLLIGKTFMFLLKLFLGLKNPLTLMSYVTPVMAAATTLLSLALDPWDEFQDSKYFNNTWHISRSCLLMLFGGTLAFVMVWLYMFLMMQIYSGLVPKTSNTWIIAWEKYCYTYCIIRFLCLQQALFCLFKRCISKFWSVPLTCVSSNCRY